MSKYTKGYRLYLKAMRECTLYGPIIDEQLEGLETRIKERQEAQSKTPYRRTRSSLGRTRLPGTLSQTH